MRVFTAGLNTETNTFAPWPTGMAGFEEDLCLGNASATPSSSFGPFALDVKRRAQADGHEFVEGLFASAQPSGPTLQNVYEALRGEILADIRDKGPFDVVLLGLHGAMVSTGCDDCEGDILARVREIAGPNAAVGAVLDPHCHLTPLMMEKADAIILMKEYPHTDLVDRGAELYRICVDAAARKVRPVMAAFDCRMIGFYPTTHEPMAGLVRRAKEIEREPGILSVSIAHGFPWGDTPETGSKILVVADGDKALAAKMAARLGAEFYAKRDELLPRYPDIDGALDRAGGCNGRVVLADTADNAGGGAPGDSVAFLRRILARGIDRVALGGIYDPMAAEKCAEAGVGARFGLRLGGKCGPASGDPIDVEVEVKAVREEHDQRGLTGDRTRLGRSAWVAIDGVDVLIQSRRTQIFAPDAFTGIGISLEDKRLVVVKSSHHYYAGFAPMADLVVPVATPGAIQMDFASIVYKRKRDLNFFPKVANPLALP